MGAVDQPLELRLTAPRTSSPLAQDYAELQEALRTYGIDASVSYAQQMLRKHDKDGSGLMEILEFAQLCRELPSFIAEGYRQDYETLQAQLGSGNPGSQDEELSRLRALNRDLRAQLDAKDRRGYGDGGGRDGTATGAATGTTGAAAAGTTATAATCSIVSPMAMRRGTWATRCFPAVTATATGALLTPSARPPHVAAPFLRQHRHHTD